MADISKEVEKSFADIGPRNPLGQLESSDRKVLWLLLICYHHSATHPQNSRLDNLLGERVAKEARNAARLADELEADVLRGPFSKMHPPFFSGFEELPNLLRAFARRAAPLAALLEQFGKPGRKGENFINSRLVVASEFVRLKTGSFNDEHLAELLQLIPGRASVLEFSGAAIRKKRSYLKRHYPKLYEETVHGVQQLVDLG